MSQKTFDNLRNEGYKGALQDMIKQKLSDLGFGSLFEQLGEEGYTGTINDRLLQKAISKGYGTVSAYLTIAGLFNDRYFTEFLASVNSHATFDSAITLTGDFEYEALVYFSSSDITVLGNTSNFDNRGIVFANGDISLRAGSATTIFAGVGTVAPNQFHVIGFRRSGSTGYIDLNGVNVSSGSIGTSTATIDATGNNGGAFSTGIPANLKIWKDGDRNTGTPVGFWPMDDAPDSTYFRNTAAQIENNIWESPFTTVGSGWTDNGDGSYTHTGVSGEIRKSIPSLTEGESYIIDFDLEGSGLTIQLGGAPTDGKNRIQGLSEGSYSYVLVAENAAANPNMRFISANEVTVRNITVRKLSTTTPYLTKQNIASGQTELFDKVDDGWTGVESIVNGQFNTDNDWTKNGNWIIAGGAARANESTNNLLFQSLTSPEGVYRESYNVVSYTSGNIRISAGGKGAPASAVGSYSEDRLATSDTFFRMEPSFSVGFVGEIDNISRKRFLEEA